MAIKKKPTARLSVSKGGQRAELGEDLISNLSDRIFRKEMREIDEKFIDRAIEQMFGHTCKIRNRYQPTQTPSLIPLALVAIAFGIFLDAAGIVDAMIEPLGKFIYSIVG